MLFIALKALLHGSDPCIKFAMTMRCLALYALVCHKADLPQLASDNTALYAAVSKKGGLMLVA